MEELKDWNLGLGVCEFIFHFFLFYYLLVPAFSIKNVLVSKLVSLVFLYLLCCPWLCSLERSLTPMRRWCSTKKEEEALEVFSIYL